MIDSGATLARRLERYRAATNAALPRESGPVAVARGRELAERMALAMDGEILVTAEGTIVRCEVPTRPIPVDRERLAALPGQPPPDAPLVCLDTETTGLATAAGTVAFLIGLGWWEGDRFRQVQLLLPDHADERALLTALAADDRAERLARDLQRARLRLAAAGRPVSPGRAVPPRSMAATWTCCRSCAGCSATGWRDARLRTAEAELLGLHRVGDVEGWEIPGRYLQFLRGGSADGVVEVVRHNDQDVRSLARLLAHLEMRFGDPDRRAEAASGDLAGLARAFAREQRLGEALACLDAAIDGSVDSGRPP